MELREALNHVAEIRLRLAESELFRGYRALPIALSGLIALAAGRLQPIIVPDPMHNVRDYILLWVAVALLSIILAAATMIVRDYLAGPSRTRALTWIAVRQFLPCLAAGAVVAIAIARFSPEAAWLLPGVWQLFFAQGIFASCRILPRPIYLAGIFYFLAGSLNFFLLQGANSLDPRAMALTFAFGQFLVAGILYWTLERRHADETEA